MAKLICQDCGEVLEENVDPEQSPEDIDGDHVHDEREGLDDRNSEDELDDVGDEYDDTLDEVTNEQRDEDTLDDLEEYRDAGDESEMTVVSDVGPATEPDCDMVSMKSAAERIGNIFSDNLRQKQKDQTHFERRSGRFDSNRMIAADRGSSKVFKRTDEGKNLKYEAYFILDRSSSMSGELMVSAEEALMKLVLGLENVEVLTEVTSFMDGDLHVHKSKSQSVEQQKGAISKGRFGTGGGTPTGSAFEIVQSRTENSENDPFIVLITDGRPGNLELQKLKDGLQECECPVLNVTLGSSAKLDDAEAEQMFHSRAVIEDFDQIDQRLFDLARDVMF